MKSITCSHAALAGPSLLLALALIAPKAGAAPPRLRVNGSIGAGYDSNIGAAQESDEKVDSAFYSALMAADYIVPLADRYAYAELLAISVSQACLVAQRKRTPPPSEPPIPNA